MLMTVSLLPIIILLNIKSSLTSVSERVFKICLNQEKTLLRLKSNLCINDLSTCSIWHISDLLHKSAALIKIWVLTGAPLNFRFSNFGTFENPLNGETDSTLALAHDCSKYVIMGSILRHTGQTSFKLVLKFILNASLINYFSKTVTEPS